MFADWEIEKEYTPTGIDWSISLRGTAVAFVSSTEWGDEEIIAARLIGEQAEKIFGPIGPKSIRIDHLCGRNDHDETICTELWMFLPNEASIVATGMKKSEAMVALLAKSIRQDTFGQLEGPP